MVSASPEMQKYFDGLNLEVKRSYESATLARKTGLDPDNFVSIPLANNMAERVVGLISVVAPQIKDTPIPQRIFELEKEYGQLDWRVGFKIAEEVALEKFFKCQNKQEAIEIGIRVGFAYLTLGIVSAPLEGFIGLKIKKRHDGKEYFALQYAGPIRGAGGTAAATSVILSDYVRVKLGYAPYDPEKIEVERYALEVQDYHERVTNLQYRPSEEEVKFMVSHLPVEVDGDPTEKIEVSNYKDLPRIETNMIRGGVALVLAEGLCQKAPKLWKRLSKWGKELDLEWGFLAEFIKLKEKIHAAHSADVTSETGKKQKTVKPNNTYLMDLVAGRPILTHPLAPGGFRLRYGRGRTTGFSSTALHPATMQVLNKYIAIGTQLKVERPGKAATVTVCDTLEGPIVKLTDGSVLQLKDEEEGRVNAPQVEEIIFLGDILFNYGDFSENGQALAPAGYCPEWWALEFKQILKEKYPDEKKAAKALGLEVARLQELTQKPLFNFPIWEEALLISQSLNVPLHPNYLFYWKLVMGEDLVQLLTWLQEGKVKKEGEGIKKIILPFYDQNETHKTAKRQLELLGVVHQVVGKENVVIASAEANALAVCFGFQDQKSLGEIKLRDFGDKNGLEVISALCPLILRDKAGTFIGARMGRPEKAKMRTMTGSPQVMFPIGEEGDRLRSFQAALQAGKVNSVFPHFVCTVCQKEMIYPRCEECGGKCEKKYYCYTCGALEKDTCRHGPAHPYREIDLDINYYFNKALERLGDTIYPDLIKGIRGTSNKEHIVEHLAKGILRAKHNIYVNKDGTTRYDCTELPLTHFKAKEIKTPIEKLKQLGYKLDIYGTELTSEDQILELKPQDIILPGYDSLDESAPKVLKRVAEFVDDLLVKFYRTQPFYNLKTEEDLVGHLVIGLAPHISAGLIGRIIGFSETQGLITHPMWHAGLRRDCVHPKTRFVYLGDQKQLNVEEIGKIVEDLLSRGVRTKIIDAVGTIKVELDNPIFALGIDPITKKSIKKKILYFIKGPAPEEWIKITTATNRTFTMTPNHDFLHLSGGSIQFKKAKDIIIGDKLPLLGKFSAPLPKVDTINILSTLISTVPEDLAANIVVESHNFFRKLIKQKGRKSILQVVGKRDLYEWYSRTPLLDIKRLLAEQLISMDDLLKAGARVRVKFSNTSYPLLLPVSNELVKLLGYYAAEGYCRKTKWVSQVCFRVGNRDIQEDISQAVKKVFSLQTSLGEELTKITICDQLIYLLFRYCFKTGSGAYQKRVPSFIFSLPDSLIAAYLSAFIDGDGTVVPQGNFVTLYSVSRNLLDDMALLLTKMGVMTRYHTTLPRLPGKRVLSIYARLQREPVRHILHHLVIRGADLAILKSILTLKDKAKKEKLTRLRIISTPRVTKLDHKQVHLKSEGDIIIDLVKKVEKIKEEVPSYCVEVEWNSKEERNVLWGEQIINTRCDGDEAAVLLLMDALLNFSRQYLPEKRGAKTMDSPLVLTSILNPAEVDDQVLGVDVVWEYPLELYQAALEIKEPGEIKIEQIRNRLGTPLQYEKMGFTHHVDNFNHGVQCSAYKTLPSMEEKLFGQMEIARKVRAVDIDDVAKLVIQKHFLKDIKGNLRKFSMQQFRCVKCNTKYRRPPLTSKCTCGGKLIFTISEGSVVKYLGASLTLSQKYDFSPYLKETLDIIKMNVDHIFGKAKEKQAGLGEFMG